MSEGVSALRDAVDERFAVTGRDTPGWPAPRAPMAPPAEAEYSRILEPEKYGIVVSRLQAWADVLRQRRAMTVTELDPATVPEAVPGHPPERVVRWTPTSRDALALVFAFRTMEGVADAVVDIGVGDRPTWIGRAPVCGCDACDDGSAALLEELDDDVEQVVARRFVHASWGESALRTTWRGRNGLGDVDLTLLDDLDDLSRLPADAVVLTGAAWVGDGDLHHPPPGR